MDKILCRECNLEKLPEEMLNSTRCRDCWNAYRRKRRAEYKEKHGEPESRRYNQAHREDYARTHAKKEQELREFVDELRKAPCTDCGKTYPPVCMDFDHVTGDKTMGICKMIYNRVSKERLLTEIAKCELVCANCHRIRTHNSERSRPWYDARRKYDRSNWNAQGM